MYLNGWKEIASFVGKSIPTVKRWHYGLVKLPYHKLSRFQQGRIVIEKWAVQMWVELLAKANQPE